MKSKKIFITLFLILIIRISFSQTLLKKAQNDPVVKKHTPELQTDFAKKNLTLGNPVFFRIIKQAPGYNYGVLEIWVQGNNTDTFALYKKYPICYFSGGLGPKKRQGDGKTPEGFYFVTPYRIKQNSTYHRAFNIGYPNKYDQLHGYTGNFIMIHGNCVSIGCIAMTDSLIEEIWTIGIKALAKGQPFFRVHIFPFYMTKENLQKYKENQNYDFWKNLKEGFDYFEKKRKPPNVIVKNNRYVFE